MARKTQLIPAIDASTLSFEQQMNITSLVRYAAFFKVGLEAITAEDEFGRSIASRVRELVRLTPCRLMYDIKLLDVENTVRAAINNIGKLRYQMFTMHAQASDKTLEAAAQAAIFSQTMPLAVTVLTDLDDAACASRFQSDSASTVMRFAKNAVSRGIFGFVCSAKEARMIRDALGDSVTIVTPAIRPPWSVAKDEQKRVTTPTEAVKAGANYVVVGRPIFQPPIHIGTPVQAAKLICEEMEAAA